MGSIGIEEWILILLIALVCFGGKRLGDVGRGLGQGIRNFKESVGKKDEKASDTEKTTKPNS